MDRIVGGGEPKKMIFLAKKSGNISWMGTCGRYQRGIEKQCIWQAAGVPSISQAVEGSDFAT
ncbi:hypothetical protein SS1G_10416 [Sclerotinia sclerotiorum 1980 UF-70]|uniref:Uncharacterized protein n=1 Tax=Sclerotinia sclerotiorum (strain ATCC 18683 / 1980 / Ss-1) TaxID=665079 RepID=A7EYK0_SCLS1|nr:hypothetical protein SS1G_10416 [Sclerotinia sclerotiorum 1980 UF-70]EDN94542.1 hypothetical protein SS1G_10416 [Sclerotinia sclerotiorum 1980 UF-70]